jgi:hypothetical protein
MRHYMPMKEAVDILIWMAPMLLNLSFQLVI